MTQYGLVFQLDRTAMRSDGLTDSEVTQIYNTDVPNALKRCGITAHPYRSFYYTEHDPVVAVIELQNALRNLAPAFGAYLKQAHIFRMDEWSDVMPLLVSKRMSAGT